MVLEGLAASRRDGVKRLKHVRTTIQKDGNDYGRPNLDSIQFASPAQAVAQRMGSICVAQFNKDSQ